VPGGRVEKQARFVDPFEQEVGKLQPLTTLEILQGLDPKPNPPARTASPITE
jgi:hypothetical protein